MMTAKTIIKDLAESGLAVNEIFTKANEKLCENNESSMFVTAWMGIIDITTGEMQFANAGHNPPLLKRADGSFEYLKTRAGFVLAGMEGIRYCAGELTLCPGDRLFLYTDGVTEATNAGNELYGEGRLQAFMNQNAAMEATALLPALKVDIDAFVGEAPQFDDITMLEEMVHAIRTDLRKEDGRYGVNTKGIFSYAAEDDISEGDSHTSVLAIGLDNVNAEISQYAIPAMQCAETLTSEAWNTTLIFTK